VFEDAADGVLIAHEGEDAHALAAAGADERVDLVHLDCLQKDPSRRPAGARDLRRRLEACADFGGWTEEAAREWWADHSVTTASAAAGSLDEELTLTPGLASPGRALP
jgi:hypothetical protein